MPPVKLNFSAPAQWWGLAPAVTALLRSRGLLDVTVDLGTTVPQGLNASFYHEVDPEWALLGSVGWQQWSKFGKVDVGVSSDALRDARFARDRCGDAGLRNQPCER